MRVFAPVRLWTRGSLNSGTEACGTSGLRNIWHMESGYLGASPVDDDLEGPPCELFFTAEDLGQVACAGVLPWSGAGCLLVLVSNLHSAYPQMVSIVFSKGSSAIIRGIGLESEAPSRPCVRQAPARMRPASGGKPGEEGSGDG